MGFLVTSYGQRWAHERLRRELDRARPPVAVPEAATVRTEVHVDAETGFLLLLLRGEQPTASDAFLRSLLERGLIQQAPPQLDPRAIALRYRRNPIENVSHVIFEFTSRCNFHCEHCYNTTVPRHTTTDLGALAAAARALLLIGVRRFDFIGGEVSRYGDGWLELARRIAGDELAREDPVSILLCTNGWWLGQERFEAAGRSYATVSSFLADLRCNGVTHVLFSVDGPAAAHDRSRGHPGLHARILDGIDEVRRAGLQPRVSLLLRGLREDEADYLALFEELARRIYQLPAGASADLAIERLVEDPFNIVSDFIDIGNGARRRAGEQFELCAVPDELLACKGFYRPAPRLTIKANGELATCRVTTAGEGYGNLHRHDLVTILNRLDESFPFQIHAGRQLREYVELIDEELFGHSFGHLCTARAILTLIARRIHELGASRDDAPAIRRINEEVARLTGHLR